MELDAKDISFKWADTAGYLKEPEFKADDEKPLFDRIGQIKDKPSQPPKVVRLKDGTKEIEVPQPPRSGLPTGYKIITEKFLKAVLPELARPGTAPMRGFASQASRTTASGFNVTWVNPKVTDKDHCRHREELERATLYAKDLAEAERAYNDIRWAGKVDYGDNDSQGRMSRRTERAWNLLTKMPTRSSPMIKQRLLTQQHPLAEGGAKDGGGYHGIIFVDDPTIDNGRGVAPSCNPPIRPKIYLGHKHPRSVSVAVIERMLRDEGRQANLRDYKLVGRNHQLPAKVKDCVSDAARKRSNAVKAKRERGIKLYDKHEEAERIRRAKAGDKVALDELVVNFQLLVRSVASEYAGDAATIYVRSH